MIASKQLKDTSLHHHSSLSSPTLSFSSQVKNLGLIIDLSFKEISKERQILRNINKYYPLVRIEKSLYFG